LRRSLVFLMVCLIAFMLFACGSDPINHLPGVDPWMDGNPTAFAEFALDAEEGPVVMINLLKFREKSADGNGTGAEAYVRYAALAGPFVERHGGSLVFSGQANEHLIGDIDYDWDMVLLVSWPQKQNLLDLAEDEDYEKIAHHRTNALERAMLIALDEDSAP
jgi:uncharacterized protein (DUF1330 family)